MDKNQANLVLYCTWLTPIALTKCKLLLLLCVLPLLSLLEHAQSNRLSGKSCRLSIKPQWLCDSLSQYGGSLARWRLNCSFFVWIPLPWLTRQHAASLQPLPHYIFFPPCPSQSNWSSTAISLCLFIYCFLTRLLFVLIFLYLFFTYLPPFLPSFVCSRVMVCCGLSTQRNNISGVGKVQPHMSCAAEGRLCEVRPIPHGSYSSRPRDQRPAISLPSPSSSSFHDH